MEFFDTFMPKLVDIIGWQSSTDEKTAAYYSKFGFRQLVLPSDCTTLAERWETLCELAEKRYAFREINRETMEQWQISLQSKLDAIAHTFEHSYRMQKKWQQIVDDSITKSSESTHQERKTETNTATGKKIFVDTPDSEVNESLKYADSIDSSTASGDSTASVSITDSVSDYRDLQNEMNKVIDGYRDLDTLFISKFEDNFINIFY